MGIDYYNCWYCNRILCDATDDMTFLYVKHLANGEATCNSCVHQLVRQGSLELAEPWSNCFLVEISQSADNLPIITRRLSFTSLTELETASQQLMATAAADGSKIRLGAVSHSYNFDSTQASLWTGQMTGDQAIQADRDRSYWHLTTVDKLTANDIIRFDDRYRYETTLYLAWYRHPVPQQDKTQFAKANYQISGAAGHDGPQLLVESAGYIQLKRRSDGAANQWPYKDDSQSTQAQSARLSQLEQLVVALQGYAAQHQLTALPLLVTVYNCYAKNFCNPAAIDAHWFDDFESLKAACWSTNYLFHRQSTGTQQLSDGQTTNHSNNDDDSNIDDNEDSDSKYDYSSLKWRASQSYMQEKIREAESRLRDQISHLDQLHKALATDYN